MAESSFIRNPRDKYRHSGVLVRVRTRMCYRRTRGVPFNGSVNVFQTNVLSYATRHVNAFRIFNRQIHQRIGHSHHGTGHRGILTLLYHVISFTNFGYKVSRYPTVGGPVIGINYVRYARKAHTTRTPRGFIFTTESKKRGRLPIFRIGDFLLGRFSRQRVTGVQYFSTVVNVFYVVGDHLRSVSPFHGRLGRGAATTSAATTATSAEADAQASVTTKITTTDTL